MNSDILLLIIFTNIFFIILFRFFIFFWKINKITNQIKKYEKNNNVKILYLVNDFESRFVNLLDIFCSNFYFTIDSGFNKFFCNLVESKKDIILIIDSCGGNVSDCDDIVSKINFLRNKGIKITAVVPYRAYSAACLITACCDEIQMNDYAFLSPIDPISEDGIQIKTIIDAYDNMYKRNSKKLTLDDEIKFYDNKKVYDESIQLFKKEIKKHCINNNINELVEQFTSGNVSHYKIFSKKSLQTKMKLKSIKIPILIINFISELNLLASKSL